MNLKSVILRHSWTKKNVVGLIEEQARALSTGIHLRSQLKPAITDTVRLRTANVLVYRKTISNVTILSCLSLWLCAICRSKKIKYCGVDYLACLRLLEK